MPETTDTQHEAARAPSVRKRQRSGEIWLPALRIAAVYALVRVAWILLSDRAVDALAPTATAAAHFQSIKGLVFVLATSALILPLISAPNRRRERARHMLETSEQHFRLFYENAPTPYQALDREGRILEVNTAWLELFDYQAEDVVGRPILDFIDPISHDAQK